MKRIILFLIVIIAFITGVEVAKAVTPNPAYTFMVSKSLNSPVNHHIDDSPFGHRIFPKPVICTIDLNGNILLNNNVTTVSNIYVYDENEFLIASLSDTIELIYFLNQSLGIYYIYLITDSGNYISQIII